jgi:hypothetical protein
MAVPGSVNLPIRPDLSHLYEALARFHEAVALGHRRAAKAAQETADHFNELAAMVSSEEPTT